MMPADVKASIKPEKTRNKRSGSSSYKFLEEVPSKLEVQCKKGVYFTFDFGRYFINLDIGL